jgi:hypothetical protein
LFPVSFQDVYCSRRRVVNQSVHGAIDFPRGLLTIVASHGGLTIQEARVPGFVGHLPHIFRHAEARDHGAGYVRRLFRIVSRAREYLADNESFG